MGLKKPNWVRIMGSSLCSGFLLRVSSLRNSLCLVTRYSIDHRPRVVPRGVASFAWRGVVAAGCGWGKF